MPTVHALPGSPPWRTGIAPFRLIFTAHNLIGGSLLARLGISFIGYHCDHILAVSPSVADSLAACGVPCAKIQVVPNGIDLAHFDPSGLDRAAARASLGVPANAFVVAAASRLAREKGIDTLLGAAGQRTGITFLVAGDGPLKPTLSRHLPSNAKLLGRWDDIRPLLAAADVFVVPSRREGQGISALEAMAAGVPLVAARVGGLADMLADGETALLVPADDPDALSAALSRLQSDTRLRQKLVASAAVVVRESYDLQTMLAAVTEVYQSLSETMP